MKRELASFSFEDVFRPQFRRSKLSQHVAETFFRIVSASTAQILNLKTNNSQINVILELPASDRVIGHQQMIGKQAHLCGLRKGAQSKVASGRKSLLAICSIFHCPETKRGLPDQADI